MDTLFLYNTKTLKEKIKTKVFAGDNHITKINVQIPDNIGGYPKRECEFNLRAIIPDGNLSYIINPNEPYFYITNDITETAQTVKLMMIITHAGNVIGRTNTVDLQVREPAEAPDPPLTPREEFDEVIAEQRAEIAEQAETISTQGETITQQGEQITELSGEVTELEADNTRLENQHTADQNTIQYLIDNPPEVRLQSKSVQPTPQMQVVEPDTGYGGLSTVTVGSVVPQILESKEITPRADTRYYAPSEGKDGFSSVTVDGATVEGLGLNENYYKLGKPFLNKVGKYNPFPENTYGGIYFTKLNEDNFPVGIKVVNYDYNYNNFSIPVLNMNTLRNTIKSFILLDCKNVKIGERLFTGASLLTICQLDGVLTIGTDAFRGCTSLTEVNPPDSLTSIGQNAFSGCSSLTGINLPDSLTSIGNNAFQDCSSLTELTLPDSLTSIGNSAFYGCTSLTELTLPDSLTSIGNSAFRYCTSLANLTLAQGFNCNGLNVSSSTRFTAETIAACLEALADRTGQTAYTITFGSTNLNKLTAEQRAIATNKNWNLA